MKFVASIIVALGLTFGMVDGAESSPLTAHDPVVGVSSEMDYTHEGIFSHESSVYMNQKNDLFDIFTIGGEVKITQTGDFGAQDNYVIDWNKYIEATFFDVDLQAKYEGSDALYVERDATHKFIGTAAYGLTDNINTSFEVSHMLNGETAGVASVDIGYETALDIFK